MAGETGNSGDVAQRLARNPLGIIALFIVLVYGIAALVTAVSGSLPPDERIPLVYFLVLFPVLVLGVFGWLVSKHSVNLYAPKDFQNEEHYVQMMTASASLAMASVKTGTGDAVVDANLVVGTVRSAGSVSHSVDEGYWRDQLLWVDDRPEANVHERKAFEAMGLSITLAESTSEALEEMKKRRFGVIISDMSRREGPREGYILLDKIREMRDNTPVFFYAGLNSAERVQETRQRDGQGYTVDPQELFRMVMRSIVKN